MFNKILVAINDSTSDRPVFERAIALAQKFDAQILLVHALTLSILSDVPAELFVPYTYPVVTDELLNRYRHHSEAAEQVGLDVLRALQAEAATQGITAEFTQNFGEPGLVICSLAKNWAADLIVMGRRGRSGLSELFWGSVSNYVLHHAPCSVFTVQAGSTPESSASERQVATVGS